MAKLTHLDPSVFTFLRKVGKNNNRDWFKTNKQSYLDANEHFKAFAEALKTEMEKYDNIEKMKLFRIYRDTRFAKDKTPYKTSLSGSFTRATKKLRGGYYFHCEPGNKSVVAGGFWQPNPADLKRMREEIAMDDKPLRKILKSASFKKHWGEIEGDVVKTAPKGYSKDHPAIDLLRHKSFIVTHHFKDKEVTSPGFVKELLKYFKAMAPLFNYMSEVLTTDINGTPLD
ncbi:MAG: DUF2461 domain-containing protein [Saprospiraceae bacterium]|nr:DUF2461 domain-containing protein [Saprospiraceae bacterium]